MLVIDPQSTAFERSEAWRVTTEKGSLRWRQQWTPYSQISNHLKRAVIASEDDGFANHDGVDWNALEKAWQKNAKAEEQAAKAQAILQAQQARSARKILAKPPLPSRTWSPQSKRPKSPRWWEGPPSPSNWLKTCFCQVNALFCAKARSLC